MDTRKQGSVLISVPLGTPLRDNPAIRTGLQRRTDDDLDGGRDDQVERVASRAAICRVRAKKEGRRECCHSPVAHHLRMVNAR